MTGRRWLGAFVASVVVMLAVACSADNESEDDVKFLEGRELVEVFRLMPPEGFDVEEVVRDWADLFGIEARFPTTDPGIRFGLSEDRDDGMSEGVSVNLQTGEFSYGFRSTDDPDCDRCADSSVEIEDAIDRARTTLSDLGFDVGLFEWSADRRETFIGNSTVQTVAMGTRTLDGRPFGTPFSVVFGDGDALLGLRGSINVPVSRGEVGLLSPEEALDQESAQLSFEVPVDAAESAELGWETTFDRFELTSFLLPVWRFTLNDDLGLSNSILAIRTADVPTE